MSVATLGFSVMMRALDMGQESNSLTVALQVRPICGAPSAAVTLWLAQLNEVFSGQLLDQTFQF
jgi:hypothetical protein